MKHLHIDPGRFRYQAMIGTGGIGTGRFFRANGNRTLGREESRSGRFLKRKDYCKLHIVSHYVQTLLGPSFRTIPIGMVGGDYAGKDLREEMAEAGMDMRSVTTLRGAETLFSFCVVYPDGSGGNLTTDDSASSRVDRDLIDGALKSFERYRGKGIALAVPEVPLDARLRLLEHGRAHDFFCAGSFTSREIESVLSGRVLGMVDLLALNLDEARMVGANRGEARRVGGAGEDEQAVKSAVEALGRFNPNILVTVTAGRNGSWAWDGRLSYRPAVRTRTVSTAGAGDAFLAGVLAGLTAGLGLPDAQELGTLIASLSVTSPHTIHKSIDREALSDFARREGAGLSENVASLLRGEDREADRAADGSGAGS